MLYALDYYSEVILGSMRMLSSHGHLLLLKYLSYDLYEVLFADLHGPCDVASTGGGGAPCGAFHR